MPNPRLGFSVVVMVAALLWPGRFVEGLIAVRHAERVVHGFLVLRNMDGTALADGDLLQTSRGTLVTSRVVFHFTSTSGFVYVSQPKAVADLIARAANGVALATR